MSKEGPVKVCPQCKKKTWYPKIGVCTTCEAIYDKVDHADIEFKLDYEDL